MNAEKRQSRLITFLMNETTLRALDDILRQIGYPRHYEAVLRNTITIKAPDLDTFFRELILARSTVLSLEINTPYTEKPSAQLIIGKPRGKDNFYYVINGSETEVTYLSMRLEEWLQTIQPWYTWITRLDLIMVLGGAICAFGLLFMVLFACFYVLLLSRGTSIAIIDGAPMDATSALYVVGGVISGLLIVAAILNAVRSWVFPRMIFALSSGVRGYQVTVFFRYILSTLLIILFTLGCGAFVSLIIQGW